MRVDWQAVHAHTTGLGTALAISSDTGSFSFFDPSSQELVVKVLDGRGLNGVFWVFYGALTNVQYELAGHRYPDRRELRVGELGDAARLIDQGALALIGGLDAATRNALTELAEARDVPLLTTRAPGDSSDDEPLRARVFHVASGPRDRRAARERWKVQGAATPAPMSPMSAPAPSPSSTSPRTGRWFT